MKVIHLISGGDTGGAKTHVHMLLQNLGKSIDVTMVCFTDGPFAQEARELGIETVIFPGNTRTTGWTIWAGPWPSIPTGPSIR